MDPKEFYLARIKRHKERAEAILDKAEKELRDLTEDEGSEYKSLMTAVAEDKTEVDRLETSEARRAQLEALGAVTEVASSETVSVAAKSVGEAFINSPEYKMIVEEAKSAGFPRFTMPTVELKAAGDPVLESDGHNADAIAPTWYGLETPGLVQYPTVVQQIMNVVNIGQGNTANWPIVTTRTSTAAATDEGATKKGATFAFDFTSATLEKYTAFGGASEEMFQDSATITNYINTELGVMAVQAEEAAIIAALYTAATGAPLDGSTISGSPTGFDSVLAAMTQIRVAGGTPTDVLLHPNDWARLQATRAVAGTGDYFSGGPYAVGNRPLWGTVREVQTPNVPEFTALVGDFGRGARLFRKGGLRVDSSNSHGTYFAENKIAIRAEIRSITGVTYPEFFVEVFLGS